MTLFGAKFPQIQIPSNGSLMSILKMGISILLILTTELLKLSLSTIETECIPLLVLLMEGLY